MGSNTRHRWPRYSKWDSMRMIWRFPSGSVAASLRRITLSVSPACGPACSSVFAQPC